MDKITAYTKLMNACNDLKEIGNDKEIEKLFGGDMNYRDFYAHCIGIGNSLKRMARKMQDL